MVKIEDVEIKWLGHASFMIKNNRTIYIDPYNIPENSEKADFVLITHSHYDHCSLPDIAKIAKEGTRIISPADCQSKITKIGVPVKMEIVHPGDELDFGTFKISTIPAYNTDKHFHPKEEGWVGYLVKTNGLIIYHAGDTDVIPEMKNLTGHSSNKKIIALLPVGGKYTMNHEEASEAAKIIKPFLAVPMHYGTIVGTEEDASEFVKYCDESRIHGKILEKE